jgi:hypothetical protein
MVNRQDKKTDTVDDGENDSSVLDSKAKEFSW